MKTMKTMKTMLAALCLALPVHAQKAIETDANAKTFWENLADIPTAPLSSATKLALREVMDADPIVKSANFTAENGLAYVINATCTVTNPASPVAGKGPVFLIVNGTATINGTAYSTQGTIVRLNYHSGSWQANVYQTKAAADAAYDAAGAAAAAQAAAIQRANHTGTQAHTSITGLGTAATLNASQTGGALSVLQLSSGANLTTGPYNGLAGAGTIGAYTDGGNVLIPDQQGVRWLKRDGTASSAGIRMWQEHDLNGGELIVDSPWRIALIPSGPIQIGNNASLRDATTLYLVSGASTVSDTMRHSKPILFNTRGYNGGAEVNSNIGIQGRQLAADGSQAVLQVYTGAAVTGFDGGYSLTNGNLTGTLAGEFAPTGLWTPGTAPTFDTLTDGATVTQTCSKYKTVQTAKVRLAGNRTLAISGAEAGMRGVIYVKQDTVGSRTLTLPTNSVKASGFALSTAVAATDRLQWEYDGTYFYWTITAALITPSDADVLAFVGAGRANISDPGIIDALNDLTLALKGSNADGTGTLWAKAYFILPMAGGTATAHSKDLKNAYDITNTGAWTTGVTHNANGITGDGTTGFGVSAFDMADAAQNSFSLYAYCSTTSPTSSRYMLGATNGTTSRALLGFSGGGLAIAANTTSDGNGGGYGGDARKQFFVTRSSSADYTGSVNSTDAVNVAASVAPWTSPIYILARNGGGTASGFSDANLRMVAAFTALSAAERTAWRTIVTNYQTSLGRANP